MTRWIVPIELVWKSLVERATTVPAGIWAVQSRVTQSGYGTSPLGRGQMDVKESEQEVLQIAKRAAGCKNGASMTRLPGNDESSENNPISGEEQLIGRRLCVEEERGQGTFEHASDETHSMTVRLERN